MPGQQLPSERLLSESLSISRMTARKALVCLEQDGYAYRAGVRTRVVAAAPLKYVVDESFSFVKSAKQQGRDCSLNLIRAKILPCPQEVALRLNIKESDPVYCIRRQCLIDGQVFMMEDYFVSQERFPGLLDYNLNDSLIDIFSNYFNVEVASGSVSIRSNRLTDEIASLLAMTQNESCLLLSETLFDSSGSAISFDQQYWRPSAVELVASISVDKSDC